MLKRLFFFASTMLSMYLVISLWKGLYSPLSIPLWLLSLLFFVLSFLSTYSIPVPHLSKKFPVTILFLFLPVIMRLILFDASRIHGDDMLTGYFSAHIDIGKTNFFSEIPFDRGAWTNQFPAPFFFFQKIFFLIFGESILSTKISVLPYVFFSSILIYAICKKVFNVVTAHIAVVLYAFFPISLYLETLGLMFVSSSTTFLSFLYALVVFNKKHQFVKASLIGITCGLCLLFYTSSYSAVPLLLLFSAFQFARDRSPMILKSIGISMVAFFIVIGPFISYMGAHNNYYLFQRINQVNLISGEWSRTKDALKEGKTYQTIISDNLLLSLRSIYENGIGGHGGYTFNHLSLFQSTALFLLVLGICISIFLIRKKPILIYFLLLTITFFIASIVLTIPPPAYHRFSLAFPIVCFLMAVPFFIFISLKIFTKVIKFVIITLVLIWYAVSQVAYFHQSILEEKQNENLQIIQTIDQRFPNRQVYIAAFPGFTLEKIFYFASTVHKNPKTDYHSNFLRQFNAREKYVYIILFPEDFTEKFQGVDKNGKVLFFNNYSLFYN